LVRTLPRTPEAFALHQIDDLDAKNEMLCDADSGHHNETGGIDYVKPLDTNPVQPLPTMILSRKVPF
jgi:3'-5' exoribonuclease